MKVADVMTRSVATAAPSDTVAEVARRMSEIDCGMIPISEGGKITGVITDRDIVVRVVAEGRDTDVPVSEVMTAGVQTCSASDTLSGAAKKMADLQMRRLLVLDEQGGAAGVLSLGDVARQASAFAAGHALEDISEDTPR